MAAISVLVLVGYVALVVARVDDFAWNREEVLLKRAIDEKVETIGHEQQAITTWDDAVRAARAGDQQWMAENIGAWMHSFYGHDRAYVLSDADAPVHAMVDGDTVDPKSFGSVASSVLPLVRELRGKRPGAEAPADLGVHDLLVLDGHPSIVSLKLIVPATTRLTVEPGREYVHVAVRYLDTGLLTRLGDHLLIKDVRFEPTLSDRDDITLAGSRGAVGSVSWAPDQPGRQLVLDTVPGIAFAGLALGGLLVQLTRRLNRTARQLKASEAHAQHQAFHDRLTGLPNRALFDARLERTLSGLGEGRGAALFYLDLDRFKNVNDTLGHPAGDELLRQVAGRITAVAGRTDFVARLGGDEFALLREDLGTEIEAEWLARAIREEIRRPFELLGDQAFIDVSVGIAFAPEAATERAELIRKADIALYEAKATGKGRVCCFAPELDQIVCEKRSIEHDLRTALERGNELRLDYQPLFASDGETLLGAEALIRWQHPVHGALSPAIFIPVAEERGLIGELGGWVLQEACRVLAELDMPWIAINVSSLELRDPKFAADVLAVLKANGVAPHRLQLEITEGTLLESEGQVTATLATLREAGIRIALDDFGTGYSSLQYLHKYSVDKIKIDRSFVQHLGEGDGSRAIVQAMLDLASAFGISVTAEGVETADQYERLVRMGCGELQGYLLSRPLDVDRLRTLCPPRKPEETRLRAAG